MLESSQAKIVAGTAAFGLLLGFINWVRMLRSSGDAKRITIGLSIVGFIITVLFLLLAIYDVNCTVIGGCNVFGWIKTILILLTLIAIILANIFSFFLKPVPVYTEEEKPTEPVKPTPTA